MKYLIFLIPFLVVSCSDKKQPNSLPKNLDSLLVLYPDSVEIIVLHGNKMLKEYKFDKAMADAAKSFRLDSSKIDVRMLYADVLNNRPERSPDDVSMAQYQYGYIIKREPKNTKALVGIAATFSQQMDFENSFKYINQALKVNPKYRDAYTMKGSNYRLLGALNPEKDGRPGIKYMNLAKSSYETAVQQDPNFYEAYLMLGVLYQAENDKICIQYYKTAAQLQPKNLEVLFSLAYAEQLFEEPEEAIEVYRKMIQIDTSYHPALNQMGVIKQHNYHEIDSAIYYYNSALQTEPRFVEAWFNLGTCYEEKGDITRALQSYAKALKYNPEFKLARDRADALR